MERCGKNSSYQILNIGCGFDTLALSHLNKLSRNDKKMITFFEVDFPEVIQEKATMILSNSACRSALLATDEVESCESLFIGGCMRFGQLALIPADLRNGEEVKSALLRNSFDSSKPTLIISECVLVYISKSEVERLVRSISHLVREAVWVSYDMISPDDSFGRVMVNRRLHICWREFPTTSQ